MGIKGKDKEKTHYRGEREDGKREGVSYSGREEAAGAGPKGQLVGHSC